MVCNDQLNLGENFVATSSVFPNPFPQNSKSTLHFTSVWTGQVRLVNEAGVELVHRDLKNQGGLTDLPELPSGKYFILWTKASGQTEMHKLVIQE
jgi:hypothetical protein